ncbi:hypothetical protein EWM64_g2042 [Hericium alpestre]|uniref:SURP motif domain-containing protein n=1 Tax=Hericium alpestre TaxID=135208 RepID=A0A4Z0A4K1_9AGAM|nr:hypothetical protein EWM64_g2042 [Hericium alpestre]
MMNGTVVATPTPSPMHGFENANGYVEPSPGGSMRFTTGMILPPPEVKSIVDRTATFVARSADPPRFEDKIRENGRTDPKFSFLNPMDPYHAYYRHRMEKALAVVEEDIGKEPPPAEFIVDLPHISAIDLDIMKLTALFAARRGRSFLHQLAAREGRNYQFDFLQPSHSLFVYFNQLVEQYQKVLFPSGEMLEKLAERTQPGAKWKMLEEAKRHAKWEQKKREQVKKREDDQEAERTAFAEIDWHDYAIVQTIEFTAADAASELPPPMSVQEVESMTLAQKRMAAMVMESSAEDVEAHRAKRDVVLTACGITEAYANDLIMQHKDQWDRICADPIEFMQDHWYDEAEPELGPDTRVYTRAEMCEAFVKLHVEPDFAKDVSERRGLDEHNFGHRDPVEWAVLAITGRFMHSNVYKEREAGRKRET